MVAATTAVVTAALVVAATAIAAITFDSVSAQLWGNGDPNGHNLRIDWTESGLEPGSQVAYRVSFDATRTIGCANQNGKVTKTYTDSTAFTSVEFTAAPVSPGGTMTNNYVAYYDGGGQNDPIFGAAASCKGKGLTAVLLSVTYSNITLRDTTNDVSVVVPYSVSYTA